MMEIVVSVLVGLGLSAATGFRVFVPLLVAGIAARTGHLSLAPGFEWLASDPALVALAIATLFEVAAFYVPWLDNGLDAVAMPAAVVAGIVMTASVVVGIDPWLKWALAIIAGGGVAAAVQALTSTTRLGSTLATAGLGNPVLASLELVASTALSLLAIAVPVVAAVILAAFLLIAFRRRARRRAAASARAG